MSGALLIHDFAEVVMWSRFVNPNLQVVSVRFDADFVTANVVSMTINGSVVSVPFHTDSATTLGDLADAIALHDDVLSAVDVLANREVIITCKWAATELIINTITVTGGTTHANGSIHSRSGGYINGVWQPTASVETTIEMSVQPLNGHELVQLQDGDRSREWLKGYTSIEMHIADEATGTRGDWITYNGKNYEVQKSERWMVTDLNHYKILMAEVNVETL